MAATKKNPYETLGVDSSAGTQDVRKAYRRMAREKHPDSGGSKEEFQELQRAYLVLVDPDRRRRYDETGDTDEDRKVPPTPLELLLDQLFVRVCQGLGDLECLKTNNVPLLMLQTAKEEQAQLKTQLKSVPGDIAKLRDTLGRLTDGQGMLKAVIGRQMNLINEADKAMRARSDSLESAVVYLRTCEYRKDVAKSYGGIMHAWTVQ